MDAEPSRAVAERFVAAINAHDVRAIVALMTKDHRFVDAAGEVHGRDVIEAGWHEFLGFLGAFPDYRIEVEETVAAGSVIALFGRASGTYSDAAPPPPAKAAWRFPAAWKATVRGSLVVEWRVYADVEPMLSSMGIRRP